MKKKGIGNCIVIDTKPIGIITESDILKKIVAEDLKSIVEIHGEFLPLILIILREDQVSYIRGYLNLIVVSKVIIS